MPTIKRPPSKTRRPSLKEAKLVRENNDLRRERDESFEREAATSEIRRMIARSPTDLQPVLDAIAERAANLCDAEDAAIFRVDGNFLRLAAHLGPIPMADAVGESRVMDRDTPAGRAIADRQTIHVPDLQTAEAEFPGAKTRGIAMGVRTVLSTPLLREGIAIGAIHIRRREMRPFSDRQIKLLETFADQAVIAIENASVVPRAATEALEQQTATSEILGVIASSPTDIQPVLDVVAENAARLCDAPLALIFRLDGSNLRRVAKYGAMPSGPVGELVPLDRGSVPARAVLDRETIHVQDLEQASASEFAVSMEFQQQFGPQTRLATPLLRQGVPIGSVLVRRTEIRPFTDKQIALLKTFADQAVIAIENARLFEESQQRNRDLTEALEQQTATSEILRVIASSPTDIQPVLDTVAENAARLCEASDVLIRRVDGDVLAVVAHYGQIPHMSEADSTTLSRGSVSGRAVIDRQTIHIHDLAAEAKDEFPVGVALAQRFGYRTTLVTPLMRQDVPIGAIIIRRMEVRPFTDKQIDLLKTFADQAVIAIENVRLFKELEERNTELREALEHQTATAEVLGIISRSPTDVQPVLDAIVESAARVCGIDDVLLRLREGNTMVARAHCGPLPIPLSRVEIT